MAERENIDITVRLRDELSRPARTADESVQSLRESTDDLSTSLRENDDAAEGAAGGLSDVSSAADDATDSVDRQTEATRRNTREQRQNLSATDRAAKGLTALASAVDGVGGGIRAAIGGRGGGLRGLRVAMIGLIVVGLVPFLYAAGGAIAALGAAAYAGVAALGPLVALLGALPALLAGVGQMFATVKMGFSGIGDAVKVLSDPNADPAKVAEALAALTPAGRDFANTLVELRTQTKEWGKSIQAAMLPGFTKLLKGLGPILPIVERGLVGTGRAVGDLAEQVGAFVGGMGADLTTIMDRNTRMVRGGFSPALLALLSILRDLMIVAGPVAERFTNWLGEASTRMAALVSHGRQSGALEAFFNRAGDRAAAFFGSLKDLSLALYNIGVESKVLGDAMGQGLGGAIADLRAWTESETGKQAIRGFFEDAIGPVMELGRMIVGLTKAWGGLVSSPTLEPLLKQIRTELGPALGDMMSNLNSGMGSAIIDIFTGLATAVAALPIQPLTTFVELLASMALGLGNLLAENPGLATFVATMLTFAVGGKVAAGGFSLLAGGFTKAAAGAKLLGKAYGLVKVGAGAALWAFKGMAGPLANLSKAQKVAAFTGRLLGLAFRFMLGPIGIALMVGAALVALFVLLYKKNDAFRAIVDRVAAAVVSFGKKAWEVLKQVGAAVWNVLVGAFKAVWPIVRTVFGLVWGYIKFVFTAWKTWFEIVIGVALLVFRGIWGAAKAVFAWLAPAFKAVAGVAVAVWNRIKLGGVLLWAVLRTGFAKVRDVVVPIWNRIRDGARSAFDGIMKVARPVLNRLQDAFRRVGDVVRGVWDGLKTGLSSAMDGIRGIVNGVIGGINKAIDGVNKVKVGDDIPRIPTLYTGGAVTAGTTAFVGELGPELFMPKGGGAARLIGAGGPELRTFAQPGYVVPNPTTSPDLTNPIPSWVQDRLGTSQTSAPVSSTPAGGGGGAGTMVDVPPITIQLLGDASGLTEKDIENAAMRAYRRFKKEQEERS